MVHQQCARYTTYCTAVSGSLQPRSVPWVYVRVCAHLTNVSIVEDSGKVSSTSVYRICLFQEERLTVSRYCRHSFLFLFFRRIISLMPQQYGGFRCDSSCCIDLISAVHVLFVSATWKVVVGRGGGSGSFPFLKFQFHRKEGICPALFVCEFLFIGFCRASTESTERALHIFGRLTVGSHHPLPATPRVCVSPCAQMNVVQQRYPSEQSRPRPLLYGCFCFNLPRR